MNQIVARIEEGRTNGAIAAPYALAWLGCGHAASVVLRPRSGRCMACGVVQAIPVYPERCVCGAAHFGDIKSPNPHREADRVTKLGDVVECQSCDREAEQLKWLRGLDCSIVAHARYRVWCGSPSYQFYRREPTSPSGVILIGSVAATPAVEAILNEKRIAPLSPAEGLCAPSRGQW